MTARTCPPAFTVLLALLCLLIACSAERSGEWPSRPDPSPGREVKARAVRILRVIDGDSLRVRYAGGQNAEVRIAGIDAPELAQPGGRRARAALQRLLRNRAVQLDAYKKDRYQRVVGNLSVNGQDIGLQMIQRGHAWHFRRFAHEQTPALQRAYAQAEANARRNGLGLWSNPGAQPPWQWRQHK